MPRTRRLVNGEEKTAYHIMSRTALDGYPFGDVEKDGIVKLLFSVCRQKIASNCPIFHPRSNKIKHLVIRSTTKLVGTHILL